MNWLNFFWIILIGFSMSGFATQESSKKYRLSACALFKNEARYIKEWIEFHRLIGVEHFYLYDNGSSDEPNQILNTYVKEGIVTLIDWPTRVDPEKEEWALATQIPAYESAIKLYAEKESEWLTFLDTEEFLVPPEGNSLLPILERYVDYAAIFFDSDFFDAYDFGLPLRSLVIESLTLTQPPLSDRRKEVTKMIFKPSCYKGFNWPPYQLVFEENQKLATVGRVELRLNHYVNRFKGVPFFDLIKEKIHLDSRLLSREELGWLLEAGYQIDDQERPIYKFIPDLSRRIG